MYKETIETRQHSTMTHQLLHGIAKCPERGIQLAHFHARAQAITVHPGIGF